MQIEYALARVQQGKMALGIKGNHLFNSIYVFCLLYIFYLISIFLARNGVVICTDKKVSSVLVDGDEYQKIQNITPTTGVEV